MAISNCYIPTQVVEWLLKYTNRLPSDAECQKCLLAPAPDDLDEATRSDLLHNRTKCLELIMKVCMCIRGDTFKKDEQYLG